ncbi:MAG: sodium-dependent transporter [Barnesiella sp.]|nr:sodium-dependent transporter [Barnesiella sp.]
MTTNNNQLFVTKLGTIAVTVGSAVGLGNIWRFPFEAGTHGGGVFIFFYLLFTLLLGIPVICSEFILGRSTGCNVMKAYRCYTPKGFWFLSGYLGIIGSLMILGFYSVVAGWTLYYLGESLTGGIEQTRDMLHTQFINYSSSDTLPVFSTLGFLLFNFIIVGMGVTKGIERVSNFLMPVLFILLLVFCVNSLTMEKAGEGIRFLFSPDFSKVQPSTIISAMGQAFFSLSIGIGTMTTYASYFQPTTNLGRTAVYTAGLDMLVALLAGLIIFPAVFTFGFSPEAGPALVFEVLPAIFNDLPCGPLWSILFFFLLFIASLTSTISMSEIPIKFIVEQFGLKRIYATVITAVIAVTLGLACTLSFGVWSEFTIGGLNIFGLFDYVASNIILPVGGFIVSIYVGWKLDRSIVRSQMTNDGKFKFPLLKLLIFCLRYIAPAGILLVFLNSIGITPN